MPSFPYYWPPMPSFSLMPVLRKSTGSTPGRVPQVPAHVKTYRDIIYDLMLKKNARIMEGEGAADREIKEIWNINRSCSTNLWCVHPQIRSCPLPFLCMKDRAWTVVQRGTTLSPFLTQMGFHRSLHTPSMHTWRDTCFLFSLLGLLTWSHPIKLDLFF